MSQQRHVQKIELFRRVKKGQRLCHYCLKRNSGKNMFARARKGTC